MVAILVVTGDYNVLQLVRDGLSRYDATILPGYSHLDAIYQLKTQPIDGVVVDALVSDPRSGEPTLHSIASNFPTIPRVIYLSPEAEPDLQQLPIGDSDLVVDRLDSQSYMECAAHFGLLDAAQTISSRRAPTGPLTVAGAWTQDEVQAFLTLSRSLTEVLDLSEVLNRIVTAARDLTDAEEGMILLPDGEGEQLYLRAKVGMESAAARNFRVKTQDTVAGMVYRSGKPSIVGQSGPQKVKTEYFVNSLLYVPILLKGRPIGVLGVNNKKREDTFDQRHQELLLHLAAYAAIAIENARVHGQSVKRARELKMLVDAVERFNRSLNIEHTLRTTVDELAAVLNINDAMVLELNPGHQLLEMRARRRRTLWRVGSEPTIDLQALPDVRSVIRSGTMRRLSRIAGGASAEWLEQAGADAMTVLPIMTDSQPIGVALAYSVSGADRERQPDSTELAAARQSAIDLVVELSQGRDRNVATIFQRGDELNTRLRGDWTELALITDDRTLARQLSIGSAVWSGETAPFIDLRQHPQLAALTDQIGVFQTHRSAESASPDHRHLLAFTGNQMVLVLPLIQRGEVAGLFVFGDSEHDHSFSNREVDLARALVGQANTALENAQLFSELQQSLNELRETQARLIQAERLTAMGELAAAVAHQINNPLTTILSDSQLLLEHVKPSSPEFESLSAIVRSGKRAKGVVRRLLAAVRTTEPSIYESVDVVASIRETLALLKPHLARENIPLTENLPTYPVPPVRAVPGELDDVWLNLLLNAHDALVGRPDPAMGIDVEYSAADHLLRVFIWDNGPGIPEDKLADIFKPFFTTKPIGEGTGLGLHIARQVVDRVGGSILVDSLIGVGTRFTVLIPTLP